MAKKKSDGDEPRSGDAGEGASEPVVPARGTGKAKPATDLGHMSMADLLMSGGGALKESVADEMERFADPEIKRRGRVNLVLLLVVLGVIGGGSFYLASISSK